MTTEDGECPLCFSTDPHDQRIQTRIVWVVSEGTRLENLLEMEDEDGQPFGRVLLCLDCYEHAIREAMKARRDAVPVKLPGQALYCRCCNQGLPSGAMILRCVPVTIGGDEPTFDRKADHGSEPVCAECLACVNDAYETWPELLGAEPEEAEE